MNNYFSLNLQSVDNTNFNAGAPLLMIGLSEKGDYIIKTGNIINTNRNLSSRYGSIYQVNNY